MPIEPSRCRDTPGYLQVIHRSRQRTLILAQQIQSVLVTGEAFAKAVRQSSREQLGVLSL